MIQIFLGAALAFFALVGIVELCNRLRIYFLTAGGEKMTFVVVSSGHDELIEYRVRSLICKAGMMEPGSTRIMIIDQGMDEETRRISRALEQEFDCVSICEFKDLPARLTG